MIVNLSSELCSHYFPPFPPSTPGPQALCPCPPHPRKTTCSGSFMVLIPFAFSTTCYPCDFPSLSFSNVISASSPPTSYQSSVSLPQIYRILPLTLLSCYISPVFLNRNVRHFKTYHPNWDTLENESCIINNYVEQLVSGRTVLISLPIGLL